MLSTEPNTPDNTTLNCKIMIVVLSHSKKDIRQGFNQLGFIKIKIKIQRTLKLYIQGVSENTRLYLSALMNKLGLD